MSVIPHHVSYNSEQAFAEASEIFSAAFNNHVLTFGSIANFRRVVKTGIPLAKANIAQQDIENILILLADPKSREIFKDAEHLFAEGAHLSMAKEQTRKSIATAESTTEAASLVFAHSILDATLFEFCRACAVAFPYDWMSLIEQRKVSFQELANKERFEVFVQLLDNYLIQLEKESLLKKADILHQITALGDAIQVPGDYMYSRDRLNNIDENRHRIIHGLQFKDAVPDAELDIDYLMRTGIYFLSIVNQKYKLRIDPQYNIKKTQQKT